MMTPFYSAGIAKFRESLDGFGAMVEEGEKKNIGKNAYFLWVILLKKM